MKPHRIVPRVCPRCGVVIDGATNADGQKAAPSLDALTVCGGCAAILRCTNNGFAQLTKEGFRELPSDTRDALVDAVRTVGGWARK